LQVGRPAARRREREVRGVELLDEVLLEEPRDDFFQVDVLDPQVVVIEARLKKGAHVDGSERCADLVVGPACRRHESFEDAQIRRVRRKDKQHMTVGEIE
jgi:glycerol-3-phosphate cytidylyltransferase-like family protein